MKPKFFYLLTLDRMPDPTDHYARKDGVVATGKAYEHMDDAMRFDTALEAQAYAKRTYPDWYAVINCEVEPEPAEVAK